MFYRYLAFAFAMLLLFADYTRADIDLADRTGYYRVTQAYLNTDNCDEAGKPVSYASNFLRINSSGDDPVTYSASSCDGENIEELQCGGSYRTTQLTTVTRHGVEGYYFNASPGAATDGTPQCTLTALRRRVVPGKGGFVRYERTDWGAVLADYKMECTREMARIFYEAQSLKCSTHIVIDAVKESDLF